MDIAQGPDDELILRMARAAVTAGTRARLSAKKLRQLIRGIRVGGVRENRRGSENYREEERTRTTAQAQETK